MPDVNISTLKQRSRLGKMPEKLLPKYAEACIGRDRAKRNT